MKFSYLSTLTFASVVLGEVMTVQLHPNGNDDKCLDVRGDVRANGTPVQIFDCNLTPAQDWDIDTGATSPRLSDSIFCLDAGSAPTDGTQMKIWECFDDLPAQEWFSTPDDRIALENQGFCLDLTNGNLTNTNVVQIWKCTDNDVNQIWTANFG